MLSGDQEVHHDCVKKNITGVFVAPQGDEMKKIGIQPIPMMDRDKKDEVPQGQVRSELYSECFYLTHFLLGC